MDKEIKNAFQTFRRTFESRLNYPEKESSEVVNAAQSGLTHLEELEVALKKKDAKEVFWITGAVVDCWHTCKYWGLIERGERSGKSKKASAGVEMLWKIQARELRKENPGISARQMAIQIDESGFERIRKKISEWERKREIPSRK